MLAGVLAFAGCSTASTVLVGNARPAISPDEVRIYRVPPAIFEEIAMIDANSKLSGSFSAQAKADKAIARLKEQAAKVGANGVLLEGISDGYGGSLSLGVGTGSYSGHSSASVGVGSSAPVTYKMAKGLAIHVIEE